MLLMERSHSPVGIFGWFTYEFRMRLALLLLGIAGGYLYGNGHTTTGVVEVKDQVIAQKSAQIAHKDKQLTTALSVAGCQQKRADVATDLLNDSGIIPGATSLPACPPVATVVKAVTGKPAAPATK